jgi:hypothetical protein
MIGIMVRRGYSPSPAAAALRALITQLLGADRADPEVVLERQ